MLKKLLVFIFLFPAQSIFAYDCTTYADRALKHSRAAFVLNCGFSGNRWIRDWQPHYNWCSSVGIRPALAEDTIRTNLLRQCATAYVWITNCPAYAWKASRQYNANYYLGCGYTGARWQPDYNRHLNWCYTASLQTINNEDLARRNALGMCIGRIGRGGGRPMESNSEEFEDLEVTPLDF